MLCTLSVVSLCQETSSVPPSVSQEHTRHMVLLPCTWSGCPLLAHHHTLQSSAPPLDYKHDKSRNGTFFTSILPCLSEPARLEVPRAPFATSSFHYQTTHGEEQSPHGTKSEPLPTECQLHTQQGQSLHQVSWAPGHCILPRTTSGRFLCHVHSTDVAAALQRRESCHSYYEVTLQPVLSISVSSAGLGHGHVRRGLGRSPTRGGIPPTLRAVCPGTAGAQEARLSSCSLVALTDEVCRLQCPHLKHRENLPVPFTFSRSPVQCTPNTSALCKTTR